MCLGERARDEIGKKKQAKTNAAAAAAAVAAVAVTATQHLRMLEIIEFFLTFRGALADCVVYIIIIMIA